MQTPEGWIRKAEKLYRAEDECLDRGSNSEGQERESSATRTEQDSMIWLAAVIVVILKGGPYALLFLLALLVVRPR